MPAHRSSCWGPNLAAALSQPALAVSHELLHLLPVRTAASRPNLSTDACVLSCGCSAPVGSAFKTADLDPAGDTGSYATLMLSGQQGVAGFSKDHFVEAGLGFVNPCSTTLSASNDSCISGASLLPLRSE